MIVRSVKGWRHDVITSRKAAWLRKYDVNERSNWSNETFGRASPYSNGVGNRHFQVKYHPRVSALQRFPYLKCANDGLRLEWLNLSRRHCLQRLTPFHAVPRFAYTAHANNEVRQQHLPRVSPLPPSETYLIGRRRRFPVPPNCKYGRCRVVAALSLSSIQSSRMVWLECLTVGLKPGIPSYAD